MKKTRLDIVTVANLSMHYKQKRLAFVRELVLKEKTCFMRALSVFLALSVKISILDESLCAGAKADIRSL